MTCFQQKASTIRSVLFLLQVQYFLSCVQNYLVWIHKILLCVFLPRFSGKQHCKIFGRLYQQGYRRLHCRVSRCFIPVPSRLSVLHSEFHCSSPEYGCSTTETSHIWIFFHSCRANGWSSLWTSNQSKLQRPKCEWSLLLLLYWDLYTAFQLKVYKENDGKNLILFLNQKHL